MAASRYKYITPMSEDVNHKFNFDGCFHLEKMRYMRREKRTWALAPEEERDMRESFDKQSWVKKIADRVELGELLECM